MQHRTKKILLKSLTIIGWFAVSIIALLLILIAIIQIPSVQQRITEHAIGYLEKEIGTEVRVDKLYISFPKNIILEKLYLEDESGDTLLYAGRVHVNTDLWALMKQEIQLNRVELENTTAYVKRAERDTLFNYSYILKAFAGDSTAVPDTLEQKGWNFTLNTIEVDNLRAHYQDKLTGNSLDVDLGLFELSMEVFDLQRYRFSVEDFLLKDTRASLVQTKLPETTVEVAEESTDTLNFDVNFDELELENVTAVYDQKVLGQVVTARIQKTIIAANKIDLRNKFIDLHAIELEGSTFSFHREKPARTTTPGGSSSSQGPAAMRQAQAPPGPPKSWGFNVDEISLVNNSIQFHDNTKLRLYGSFDAHHLSLTNLDLAAHDVHRSEEEMGLNIDRFSFVEKNGFTLESLRTAIQVSEDSAVLSELILETTNSTVNLQASAVYDSFSELVEDADDIIIRANIDQSHVGMEDIIYFLPALRDSLPVHLNPDSRVFLNAGISGTVSNMLLHHLSVGALSDTRLDASGTVIGMPQMENLYLNISLDKLYTTKSDMMAILPDTLLPDSITLPEWVNVNGNFKGNFREAEIASNLTSDLGSVNIAGNMNLDSTSVTRGFDGKLDVNEFDLGDLLMQPKTIGKLDLQASIHSDGLTKEEMNSAVEVTVNHFQYKDYTYKDLKASATVRNDIFKGWASLKDPNLDFTLEGDINFRQNVPHYDFTFDLRNIDLQALQLAERPLKGRGTLEVDMATADMRVLNGSFGIRKVAIFNGDALYAVDSLLFASVDQDGRSEIRIDSDLMEGRFEGSLNVFEMPAVLREYFNTYYSLHDSVEYSYEDPQHFLFHLDMKKTDLLTDIIFPQLKSFEPGEIKGEFASKEQKLNLRLNVTEIQYANVGIESLVVSTNSDSTELNYNILIDEVTVDSMRIDGVEFNGTVADDSIRANIVVRDSLDFYKYLIAGIFFSRENEFELRLDSNDIRLNYETWKVPGNNYIRFGADKLVAQNVELSNGNEKIIIESKPNPGSPLLIGFRQLNLEYLSSMIAAEKPVSGLLQGDISLYLDDDPLQFTADVKVSDLAIFKQGWGDLALSVEQRIANRFDVNFMLTGDANDIRAQGFYTAGENATMDLNAYINKFDLAVLAPMLMNQVEELGGRVDGELHASGSPQQPDIDGQVNITNAAFYSTFLRTAFSIRDESIAFEDRGIALDQFQLVDANSNTATLDGMILTRNYRDYAFDLNLKTQRFQLLNTTEKDNDLFFGKLNINADARIEGTMINPEVDMEVSLTKGDHFTYIVPQEQATILEQQGIVRFVDKTFKADPFMKKIQSELTDTVKSTFRGIDLTAKLELTDKESLTIVIDPTTEDQLTVKGNTTLTLQMDRTGDIQLAGRYEITEGTYNLSFYKFVKREFSIEKGSTMTWTGDPLNATMDINAIYRVETSPIELLANQLTTQQDMNRYRQRLPFLVYLQIDGQLLKPEISFRLEMPMDERNSLGGNVYARLQDINTRESDLNKQVFALLILKRFIADNPFENKAGAGFEGTARTSVSKIMTEQLNRLSENIRGIELSFDVKSYQDYSTGSAEGQTELQLGLSKRLLNDRLVVKLSGNVDIEGENTNHEVTDYIGDLAVEYLLTQDGRFRITGFRNSNYDMIDGELIETGAGLIYIKDYNTLRELFSPNAKDKNKTN